MPVSKKRKKTKKFKAPDGKTHQVYKNSKGDVIVDHTAKKGGKWDKINLTEKAGAKTLAQGKKATINYHNKAG